MNKKVANLYNELIIKVTENQTPCTGVGHLFDTDESIPIENRKWNEPIAKSLCLKCPLMYECLTYALVANEEYGIWGGHTPDERTKMKPPTK